MFDIVTVGGATQDIFLFSPDFDVSDGCLKFNWGEKFVVERLITDAGGGACNSAVGFSRLGLNCGLMIKIGNDYPGKFVIERLNNEKVATDFVEVLEGESTSLSTIFVDETGERSIVMYRANNDSLLNKEIDFDRILETEWLYVSEITGDSTPFVGKITETAFSKEVKIAFLPGLQQIEKGIAPLSEILPRVEVMICNSFEAAKLLGMVEEDYREEEAVKKMLKILADHGIKKIVITKDIDGVQVFDGDYFYSYPKAYTAKVVDTTGAGDAFATGFIASIIKGRTINEALELGTKNSAAVISRFGAQTGLIREN